VTLYGRIGDLLFWLAVLAGLAVAAPWSRLRRRAGAD
jgi:apolipoprotein N-acyltransferase